MVIQGLGLEVLDIALLEPIDRDQALQFLKGVDPGVLELVGDAQDTDSVRGVGLI